MRNLALAPPRHEHAGSINIRLVLKHNAQQISRSCALRGATQSCKRAPSGVASDCIVFLYGIAFWPTTYGDLVGDGATRADAHLVKCIGCAKLHKRIPDAGRLAEMYIYILRLTVETSARPLCHVSGIHTCVYARTHICNIAVLMYVYMLPNVNLHTCKILQATITH